MGHLGVYHWKCSYKVNMSCVSFFTLALGMLEIPLFVNCLLLSRLFQLRASSKSMPPHPSSVTLSNTFIVKNLSTQFKPNSPNPFPDPRSLLQQCNHKNHLNQIHAFMITTGLIHNPPTSSKLIASFASTSQNNTTFIAHLIAEQTQGLDTYTWNTIIKAYLEEKNPKEALSVYAQIRRKSLNVDSYTLLYATKACGSLKDYLGGEQIHNQITKVGFLSEMIIVTSLVNMYGLLNDLDSAQRLFDETPQRDFVLWNALIAIYGQRKQAEKAILVLRSMVKESVRPNEITAVSVLSACSCLKALREGKQVHCYVLKNLIRLDVYVYNALIDMYSKCGKLVNALQIFQMMPVRNVVSWTTMVNRCSDNNQPEKALDLCKEMELDNVKPDEVTVLAIISLCSKLGSSKLAEWIDHYVTKNLIQPTNVCVTNALIDMHSKCGNITRACQLFDQLEEKTMVSWSSMIQGLAMHGYGTSALTLFFKMQREGFKPDEILFFGVLSACSHACLVEEGRECFRSMVKDYNIKPGLMHYGCMVDLLCRAGEVSEAFELVKNMEITPDVIIWRILLGACRNQGDSSLANQIMSRLRQLEPEDSGNYVVLSNLYADFGEWGGVEDLRREMRVKGVGKQDPGISLVEVN